MFRSSHFHFVVFATTLLHGAFCLAVPIKTKNTQNQPSGFIDCDLCKVTVKGIQDLVELNATGREIYPLAVKLCESVLKQTPYNGQYMCPGFVSAYGIPLLYVVPKIALDPSTICRDLNICTSSPSTQSFAVNSILRLFHKHLNKTNVKNPVAKLLPRPGLDSSSSDYSHLLNTQENPLRKKAVQPKSGNITFLQLADIHIDRDYAEGSPTDCHLFQCCRSWYNGTGSAGHYGSYSCDLPKSTLDLLAEAIKNVQPAPDFIIYTGDNPPHDIWNETWSSTVQATQTIVDYFAERMPSVPIYPAMGNHESWPISEFMASLKEYQMLTHNLSIFWEKWVDLSPEAKASIAHGGYYSMLVMKGLRVISFNTDYGLLYNFYTFLNDENVYYAEQWQWLERELRRARNKSEKVLMIGHVPPGDEDVWGQYGHLYLNLTKQFKDTIVGHFFGHTHMDQFKLIQDNEGVYGVVLIAPSVTPYGHINPSFRTFTMDTDTMQLLHYTQYALDLPKVNDLYAHGHASEVMFVPSYTTLEQYQLDNLSPESWSKLSKKFLTDAELLNSYYYSRHGKSKPENKVCDEVCQKLMLCEVNHIVSTDLVQCLI